MDIVERMKRNQRSRRFQPSTSAPRSPAAAATAANGYNRGSSSSGHTRSKAVVGTCQRLEKRYFRLTSEPDPADVRPLPVLRQVRTAAHPYPIPIYIPFMYQVVLKMMHNFEK